MTREMQTMTDLQTDADDLALTLTLGGEIFAIPVSYVNEVVDPLPVTRVPGADPSAPGLVNVRGTIAPFIDLRHRFGMSPPENGHSARMLVLDLPMGAEHVKVATLADEVAEVIETPALDLDAVPAFSVKWPTHLIKGVARSNETLVILIDVDAAFAPHPC